MADTKNKDAASQKMHDLMQEKGIESVWERAAKQEPHCGYGSLGLCCKNCNLGPCRVDPFENGAECGVCGADRDIIASRNLLRHIAGGTACHNDHGREMAYTLYRFGDDQTTGYSIRGPEKLKIIAEEWGISLEDKSEKQLARELGRKMLEEFGQQNGELNFVKRVPLKQQKIWKDLGVTPRGEDREVVESLSRTNIGVDNDYKNLIYSGLRCSLSDGWGGSMIATELSDIFFGQPRMLRSEVNLGVLKEDEVNILVHGHVPLLSDVIATIAQDPELIKYAKTKGAKRVNIAGICCTANEILVRRGIPIAGSLLQQELAIATGAVELMVVDLQCVFPALNRVAGCFHTKLVSTQSKAKFPGMEHIEFKEEDAENIAKQIVKLAIDNFPNRKNGNVNIPKEKMSVVAGTSAENIFYHLGGKYRASYRPLNDNIINGRIRGVAAVVGCDNPKNLSGASHSLMVKELIKNDVLVVQTGCSAIDCGKEGLLQPEAAFKFAGPGLQEVCAAVGIPPVLHMGSCVDNSRVLIACCEMVKEGGIGNGLDELPIAAAAPEWMSEKAIAIGMYAVASGALVVIGSPLPLTGSKNVTKFLTEDLENITGGKWAFESDPIKAAGIMIDHINKKREALKLQPMLSEKQQVKV
ncbi:MAG: anaerobic carbon-monoxide dehydrogenase catalytic subunit [Elusimicrobiota bacterium]